MPIDAAKLNERLDRFVTDQSGAVHVTEASRSQPSPMGTWTIDPADSTVSFAWPKLRLWTITGQLPCLGVIHLDDLPPVGVIRFQQPSGLPVLTMALDPASMETGDADLDATPCGPDAYDVLRHRWWTLRSESLEVLPGGTWRVMATLTANGTQGLVELRFEIDPETSGHGWLVMRGRGVLDRRAFGMGKRASFLSPTIQLDLTVRARQVETSDTQGQQGEKVTCTTSMPG
jgi:polyisoprenoid-binding protein YceI